MSQKSKLIGSLIVLFFQLILPCEQLYAQSSTPTPNEVQQRDLLLPPQATLQRVVLKDSTVLTQEQVDAVASEYQGKKLTLENVLEIQRQLTALYVQQGYITSSVQFFRQDNEGLEAGEEIIVLRAIEGKLEAIEVEGLSHLRESYVRDRLLPYASEPLNIYKLEEGLLVLRENRLVERINTELVPGSQEGQSIWLVRLEEAPRWRIGAEVSNEENPIVGEWGGKAQIENRNVLGFGDGVRLEYKRTEGLERFLATTLFPVNAQDGSIQLSYQLVNARITAEPFESLDIRNDSYTISASFQQPLVRTPTDDFSLGLSFDFRESQSYVFNDFPFSFEPNVRDGFTQVTALRFNQNYRTRDDDDVLALNSQLSFGWINLIDNSNFFSWQGQLQWLHSFSNHVRLFTRLSAQLSPDSLPALEQCAIGGLNGNEYIFGNTVIGYATNTRNGDNCLAASTELPIILVNDPNWGTVSLVPFINFATVWDNEGSALLPNTLISTGIGLHWQINEILSLRIDYGIPLKDVPEPDLEEQRWNLGLFVGIPF